MGDEKIDKQSYILLHRCGGGSASKLRKIMLNKDIKMNQREREDKNWGVLFTRNTGANERATEKVQYYGQNEPSKPMKVSELD